MLADPSFVVPPVPEAVSPGGIGWLRANVSRFSNGEAHERRRALVVSELERLDLARLRRAARVRATTASRPAESVPVEVLAAELGLTAIAVSDVAVVAVVAAAYHPHVEAGAEADAAVGRLVEACGGTADEATAVRISLLVQTSTASAALVGSALRRDDGGGSVEELLSTTLRTEPPVPATRRLATAAAQVGDERVEAGRVVTLDLTAGHDERLQFGSGLRPCPGRDQALAIVAGILDAARRSEVLTGSTSKRVGARGSRRRPRRCSRCRRDRVSAGPRGRRPRAPRAAAPRAPLSPR